MLQPGDGETGRLLARGLSDKQIAERLVIAPKTAGAAMFAVQHGLLPEEKVAATATA